MSDYQPNEAARLALRIKDLETKHETLAELAILAYETGNVDVLEEWYEEQTNE